MEFSHWQISLKIAKGLFETRTSIEKSITVDITGKDGKATDLFLVAFFQPIGTQVINQPDNCISCKPTKDEVLKALEVLKDLINRM